ncbi:MAG: 4-alpha-glucanotransferase [Treponema sp.]|jgi:4-alpha-glucanotransferase|nr:4-alpha-glucanotransferase [Treponema sp.]
MQKPAAGKRLIGVAVPVGALRSKNGMGVGEFPDLADFANLCKKMKLSLIQILPVNDTGFESSPYSSLTAFGLHPLYLRIEDIGEYETTVNSIKKRVKDAKDKYDKDVRFSHYQILKEKIEICRFLFETNKPEIRKSADSGKLSAWIEQNPWVKEYAVYRRLKGENGGKSWKEWPEYRAVTEADIDTLWNDKDKRDDHLFWAWLQEALDTQFSKAARAVADAGIVLKGDLPILMNEDSCDVWCHPGLFVQELSAGSPPDMYNPEGQNWGFPIYNWEAHKKDNYAWWRRRLETADKYYKAYRIDHVLGFFRIWASSRGDYSSVLGRYVPYLPVTSGDLKKLGFDKGRIRWVSRPHIPTGELYDALRNSGSFCNDAEAADAAGKVFSAALDRINNEELWLFKKEINGEKNIKSLDIHPAAHNYLIQKWRDRIFLEYENGRFFPVWYYKDSKAYNSLSWEEKNNLEALLEKHRVKSERAWAVQGMTLLSVLVKSSSMLPCAEDLGAVPDCVPKVLSRLKILGLRVVRWFREWEKEGQPYIPFDEYPPLSVCTASVHDSSTVREWWEKEANQEQFSWFLGVPYLSPKYNPGVAKVILSKAACARSRIRVFQIQDLLHLSSRWYSEDPAHERINVPGTYNDFNWTYRLPAQIEEISKDRSLTLAVSKLGRIKPVKKKSRVKE